jgi:hypothetical protein
LLPPNWWGAVFLRLKVPRCGCSLILLSAILAIRYDPFRW